MSGSRGRRLNDDERVLWREITRGIQPPRPPRLAKPQPPRPKTEAPPVLAPLGRRAKQRVARGRDPIDGRIDLHGLTQAEAHDALLRFLYNAQTRGARLVMVITGKGRGGEGGVLKRQVPHWLASPEFRALIVGYEEAHQRHGGEGALYLRVRKVR
jgi:DNA-nicking Smr family endonuclease